MCREEKAPVENRECSPRDYGTLQLEGEATALKALHRKTGIIVHLWLDGKISHERIWLLAPSCWFSSQDSRRALLLMALTFTLDCSLSFQSFFLNLMHLDRLMCRLVLMRDIHLCFLYNYKSNDVSFVDFSNLYRFIVS